MLYYVIPPRYGLARAVGEPRFLTSHLWRRRMWRLTWFEAFWDRPDLISTWLSPGFDFQRLEMVANLA